MVPPPTCHPPRSVSDVPKVSRSRVSSIGGCSSTSNSTDSTRQRFRADVAAIHRRARPQAGDMAKWPDKAEKRPKRPRLPSQVDAAISAAADKQALDLVVLDLRKAAGFTDYFIICSGSNPRQIRAIADGVLAALAADGVKPAHIEGHDRS